jgi:hypothetical protein
MIVVATAMHAALMDAAGIRPADREEWVGGVGGPVLPALIEALGIPGGTNSTYLLDGTIPLCMWGDYPVEPSVGQVWLIATVMAERHVLAIHRVFTPVLTDMHSRYPLLVAYMHPRNALHQKWIERHGFKLNGTYRTAALGIPYLRYTHICS